MLAVGGGGASLGDGIRERATLVVCEDNNPSRTATKPRCRLLDYRKGADMAPPPPRPIVKARLLHNQEIVPTPNNVGSGNMYSISSRTFRRHIGLFSAPRWMWSNRGLKGAIVRQSTDVAAPAAQPDHMQHADDIFDE